MTKKILYLIPVLLWASIIIFLTLQPADVSSNLSGGITLILYNIVKQIGSSISMETFHLVIRKLAHFTEYFILGLLTFLALVPYTISFRQKFIVIFWFGFIFASLDETIQLFVDGRAGSIRDVLIDGAGVLFSIMIIKNSLSSRKKLKV